MAERSDDIPLAITNAIDTISSVLNNEQLPEVATQKLEDTREVLLSTREAAALRELDFEALEDAYCEAISDAPSVVADALR